MITNIFLNRKFNIISLKRKDKCPPRVLCPPPTDLENIIQVEGDIMCISILTPPHTSDFSPQRTQTRREGRS